MHMYVSVCIHAHAYAHICKCTYIHVLMCVETICWLVSACPPQSLFTLIFYIESLTRPELTSSTRLLTGQWGPGVLLSLFPQWLNYRCILTHPALHIGTGDPNSSSHVCAANTFMTEPYFPSQHLLLSLHNKHCPILTTYLYFGRTREWMNYHFRPVVTYMAVVAFALILWKQSILKHVLQIQ